jgi:hypothetical protein
MIWARRVPPGRQPRITETVLAVLLAGTQTLSLVMVISPSAALVIAPRAVAFPLADRQSPGPTLEKYPSDYTEKPSTADRTGRALATALGLRPQRPVYPVRPLVDRSGMQAGCKVVRARSSVKPA